MGGRLDAVSTCGPAALGRVDGPAALGHEARFAPRRKSVLRRTSNIETAAARCGRYGRSDPSGRDSRAGLAEGLDDVGFADSRGPEVGGVAAGFGPGAYGLVAGGEEGFGGEHERAPVHGRHPGYADVLAGPYRLGRADVDRAHEPARQV